MIALGKRKLDNYIKMEDGSFVELIKKPKQEFGITTTSHNSNAPSSLGKVIGMVASPNKTNGASRVVCLKLMKPPTSFPTINTINNNNNSLLSKNVILNNNYSNNNNSLLSKSVTLNNYSNNNNSLLSKSVTLNNNYSNNNNFMNIKRSPSKTLIVTSLASPKPLRTTSLTSVRIKTNNSPLNPITNIVVPIKQEKLLDTETTQKYQVKKECIIKPLSNLPKNFFYQTNNNINNNSNNVNNHNNGMTGQKPVMRIVSLQSNGIKQERGFGGEPPGNPTQKIKKLKTDETLQPVRLKVISPMKAKPIVVVSPLNYHAHKQEQEEDKKAGLDLEDLMIKTSIKMDRPSQQEYVHASLWYDKDLEEFTVSNFLTDSPICLLKNMLISGEYLTEQDSVVYLLDEQQVPGEDTLKQLLKLGESNEYMLVDIKFVFRKQDTIIIAIYSVTPAVEMMTYVTNDQNGSEVASEETSEIKRKRSIKKRKDKSALTSCDKGRSAGGRMQLWQFLLTTLLEGQHPDKIEWTSHDGEFKFTGPDLFAKVWGASKGKKNMSYNNLSRAIRYYYDMGIMSKVRCHQFRYKFTMDIKATTGYTFAEIRRLYEKDSLDPNCPNWGRFIALRELLASPITAQTNSKKIEDSGMSVEAEAEHESIHESKSDFEEGLGHDQSLFFGEDHLATTNLAELLSTGVDAYLGYSLDDPS